MTLTLEKSKLSCNFTLGHVPDKVYSTAEVLANTQAKINKIIVAIIYKNKYPARLYSSE